MMAKSYPSTEGPLKLSPEECHPLKRPTRCINIESNLSGVVGWGRCTNQSSETRAAGLGKAETSRRLNRNRSLSRPRCETHEEELERRPISRCSFNSTPLLWKLFLISCYLHHVQVKNFIKANTHGFYGYLFLFGSTIFFGLISKYKLFSVMLTSEQMQIQNRLFFWTSYARLRC